MKSSLTRINRWSGAYLLRGTSVGAFAKHSIGPSCYVFTAVFLLRLIVLGRLSASEFLLPNSGDMQFYNDWARRILEGHWTDHHAFYGLPLYAYLLALLYKFFGYSPFIPGLFQALLEAGTAVLLYKLAIEIFRPRKLGTGSQPGNSLLDGLSICRGRCIGLLAALGWGFFLPEQAYAAILMPTAGLVFVFWFVVWYIVGHQELPSSSKVLFLGVLIGFTAMGIATILFLVPLLVGGLLFKFRTSEKQQGYRLRLAAIAFSFLGIGIGTSPCWIHNYFVAKDPVFLSAHSGVNFWIGNNPVATGYPRFPPGLHAGQRAMLQDSIATAEKAAGRPLKRSQVSAYWSDKARSYIKDNFSEWLRLVLVKTRNFWNAFQYDDLSIVTILRDQGVLLPGFKFGLVAALGLSGLVVGGWKFPLSRWVSAAVLLHMASLLTVFVTERYRAAAVPGLLLGASFAMWNFWQDCVTASYRKVAIACVVVIAATLFVSMPQRDPGLWALDAYNSGWQALQVENYELAQKKLELSYAYVPGNAEINFALGNLHLARGDLFRAKQFYAASLRLDPGHAGVLNNLGVLALKEERWELASKFFVKASEQDPTDAKSHYLLAQTFFRLGDRRQAKIEIEKAIELSPNHPEFFALKDHIQ